MSYTILFLLFFQNPPTDFGGYVLVALISAIIPSVMTYLVTRRMNTASSRKTESEAIKNYLEIIIDLQGQLEIWITKVKDLRVSTVATETMNYELKQAIKDAKTSEQERMTKLHWLFKQEKERLYQHIVKVLRIAKEIEAEVFKYANQSDLKRETIRIVEMLTYVKGKLDPENKDDPSVTRV